MGFTEFISSENVLEVCPAFAEFVGVEVRDSFSYKVGNDHRSFLVSFRWCGARKEGPGVIFFDEPALFWCFHVVVEKVVGDFCVVLEPWEFEDRVLGSL